MPDDKSKEDFAAFLKKHSISGDAVLGILAAFDVSSLGGFRSAKEDPDTLKQLKAKFEGRPIVIKALDRISLEAIDNAIHYSKHPGAEVDAQKLMTFLTAHDVLAGGDESDEDILLSLLRTGNVTSLESLKSLKNKGQNDAKLAALTAKITQWRKEAGASFESITPAMVSGSLRTGEAAAATPELKAFLKKNGLPAGAEKELTESGITTLEQFRAVKQDPASLKQLKERLDNSGIRLAAQQIDDIKVDDIDHEIAVASSPLGKEATARKEAFTKAITEVEALRDKVTKAAETDLTAVGKTVTDEYNAVLAKVKDLAGTDFTAANADAKATREGLSTLLSAAITDMSAAREILANVDSTPRPLAKLIRDQYMLRGFLLTPDKPVRSPFDLVKLPQNLDSLTRDPDPLKDYKGTYKGSVTTSFATLSAQQASRSLAVAGETSGAFPAGTGVAAVSAAARYAESQKASRDTQEFQSATVAECGEIRYIYMPRQTIEFDKRDIQLSHDAMQRLEEIAQLPAGEQADKIVEFYADFGSHFFLRYSLGGRYQFKATGKARSETAKGQLVEAVAHATEAAVSASGSYAGLGGAAKVGMSFKGQQTDAQAKGEKSEEKTDVAETSVEVEVHGGAQHAPRDIWVQTLRYNTLWAVIDRDVPRAVWQLVADDKTLSPAVKGLAAQLQKVWVRRVFLNAAARTHPFLHNYLKLDETIQTATALEEALEKVNGEPPLKVVVVKKTSATAQHPKVTATSTEKGHKLIGGGATVDYGQGPGILLTGSYPYGNSWIASAKDHLHANAGTVTAYAIYLDDPYDLWDVAMVPQKSETRSGGPQATAKLPRGYAMTGGGALVDWSGPGILLTACCPAEPDRKGVYTAWTAKGKAHLEGDSGSATAWVFGIRPRNGVEPTSSTFVSDNMRHDFPTLEKGAKSSGQVVVGGGAEVLYSGAGGLLTRCGLSSDHRKWAAQAKGHGVYDGSLDMTIWVISRDGEMGEIIEE